MNDIVRERGSFISYITAGGLLRPNRLRVRLVWVFVTAIAAATFNMAAATADRGTGQWWPMAGQNLDDTRFQAAEHAISTKNVSGLTPRWIATLSGAVAATPTVYKGVVYVPDSGGKLWAIGQDGQVLWSRSVSSYTGVAGDLSRTSPAVFGDELILGDQWILAPAASGARVFAVDRHTGNLRWVTQVDSAAPAIITGSPTIYNGVAYLGISAKEEALFPPPGTTRGAVVAVNATTGKLIWKTYTVPSNNNNSDANLPGYYSGNAVWASSPAIDPARGLLYIGTGNNYTVPDGVCTSMNQTGCTPPARDDYVDSILALSLTNGSVAWSVRGLSADSWTFVQPLGSDFDFGNGANLFRTINPSTGQPEQLLGIGEKSGVYWAVDPGTGKVVWQTVVGPGGLNGGLEWGSATDGKRIYVAEAGTSNEPYILAGTGPNAGRTVTGGSWAALDPASGKIIWQTPDPQGAYDTGFVSTANGVVYGGSLASTGNNMYALDASTGKILWGYASGGSVAGGAAIVDGAVYWGSGYCGAACVVAGSAPLNNNKLDAFALVGDE